MTTAPPSPDDRPVTSPTSGRSGRARRLRASALGFARSPTDRVVAGVAGGLAARLGVDAVILRIAFVALAFAGGAGVVLYLLAWAVSPEEEDAEAAARAAREPNLQQAVALGLIVLGVLLLLRQAGLWVGDSLVWPVVIAAVGSAIIWTRGSEADRARWSRLGSRIPGNPVEAVFGGRISLGRVTAGGLLIAFGMAAFLAANDALIALRDVALAVVVTLAGAGLIFGPWLWRLLSQLGDERRERIRSEERAEMAAHLHDSVLQTLALIQRSSDQPRRMVSLARRQERELRQWLYGERDRLGAPQTLRGMVDAFAEEVEASHDVAVEVVVVGDTPVDADVRALLNATREATVNAAKHADVGDVSVFVEAAPDLVEAFVRDRGRGFDPDRIPGDRRGISESIRGRMARHGGTAEISSEPGAGTEVTLRLERDGAEAQRPADQPSPPAPTEESRP